MGASSKRAHQQARRLSLPWPREHQLERLSAAKEENRSPHRRVQTTGLSSGSKTLPTAQGRVLRALRVRGQFRAKACGRMKSGLGDQWGVEGASASRRPELALEIAPHAYCRAEPGLRGADEVEADPLAEALRGSGGDLERLGTLICRAPLRLQPVRVRRRRTPDLVQQTARRVRARDRWLERRPRIQSASLRHRPQRELIPDR